MLAIRQRQVTHFNIEIIIIQQFWTQHNDKHDLRFFGLLSRSCICLLKGFSSLLSTHPPTKKNSVSFIIIDTEIVKQKKKSHWQMPLGSCHSLELKQSPENGYHIWSPPVLICISTDMCHAISVTNDTCQCCDTVFHHNLPLIKHIGCVPLPEAKAGTKRALNLPADA